MVGLFALAGILGQATMYHRAAPFAYGLLVLVWMLKPKSFLPGWAGAILGTAVGAGWPAAGLLGLLALPVPAIGRRWVPLWIAPVWAGIGGALIFSGGIPHAPAPALLAGLAGALGAVSVILGLRGWQWLSAPDVEREPVSLAVGIYCAAAVLAGIEGVHLSWWWPGLTVGGFAMLLAAYAGGAGGGALAGATLGVTLAIRGGAAPGWVGMFTVAGFLAGLFARRRWRLMSVGLMVGMGAYLVFLRGPLAGIPALASVGVGALLFQAVPDFMLVQWDRWLMAWQRQTDRTIPLRDRMERVAHVLQEMAHVFAIGSRDLSREANPVETVVSQVCQRCSLYRPCWEGEFYRTYRGVQDLVLRAEEQPIGPAHLGAFLQSRCIKPDRLAEVCNSLARDRTRDMQQHRVIEETRQLARAQLRGMASLLGEMAQDICRPEAIAERGPLLAFSVGVAKRPRSGGQVSGDAHLVRELDRGRVVIGLSDGMGVGPAAAYQSGTAVSLLEELLKAGFSQTMAVKAVNTALILRSPEERFVTMDLALFDLLHHQAELVKVAAAPTFIRRRQHVEVVRSESLPIGILRDVTVQALYHKVEPGDILVMVSDGVLGSPDVHGDDLLLGFLEKLPVTTAPVMAETLLSLMLDSVGDARDDALVVVVRIAERPGSTPVQLEVQSVAEWQRVTPFYTQRAR